MTIIDKVNAVNRGRYMGLQQAIMKHRYEKDVRPIIKHFLKNGRTEMEAFGEAMQVCDFEITLN